MDFKAGDKAVVRRNGGDIGFYIDDGQMVEIIRVGAHDVTILGFCSDRGHDDRQVVCIQDLVPLEMENE